VRWTQAAPHAALANADWLDAARSLEPGSVDLVYIDPPFAAGGRRQAGAGGFDDRWRSPAAYRAWLGERLEATRPLLKAAGAILLHVDWRASHHARLLLDETFGPDCFVNHLVWAYGLGGSSTRRFARKHDDILYYAAHPDGQYFDPPRVPASSRRMAGGTKKATDVLHVPAINNMARERVGWPTQKPLALLELLIGACSPPDGAVMDPCCGSGTTLVAARRLSRRALGADVAPDAIEVARRRLTEHASPARTKNGRVPKDAPVP